MGVNFGRNIGHCSSHSDAHSADCSHPQIVGSPVKQSYIELLQCFVFATVVTSTMMGIQDELQCGSLSIPRYLKLPGIRCMGIERTM